MDHVFDSGAAGSPPSPPASPSTGYPTKGNPGVTPPTIPGEYWFYQVTEEIRSAVVALGGTPDHTNVGQVAAGLLAALTQRAPPGGIMAFAMSSAPTGWLKANGAAVSRTTYAALFAAIGTTFGVGDGSTTFNLPDMRGEFIRGWDDSRGIDSGRAIGTAQKGSLIGFDVGDDGIWIATTTANTTVAANQVVMGVDAYSTGDYSGAKLASASASGSASLPGTGTVAGASGVVRPRNVAHLFCIKY